MSGRSVGGALAALALTFGCGGGGKGGSSASGSGDGGGGGTPTGPTAPTTPSTPGTPTTPPTTPTTTAAPPATPGTPGTACAAATCASLGKSCGPADDGCGGNLFCGSCAAGQVCGGGGTANVCGPPAATCAKTSCAAAGKTCGVIPDGCGSSLECGTCSGSQTCGGGGTANVCGAPPAQGGDTRWVKWLGGPDAEKVRYLRSDAAGELVALATRTTSGGATTIIVRKHAADGTQIWERTFQADPGAYVDLWGLAVSGGGSVFFSLSEWCYPATCAGIDFGGGAVPAALVKLASDGSYEWQKTGIPYGGAVAADANGNVAAQRWDDAASTMMLELYDFSGKTMWTQSLNGVRPLAFAPDGSLYVSWYDYSDYKPRLSKLDGSGSTQWTRTTPNGIAALATSGRGTPVALEWDQLAVYEAVDGAERFRVSLPMYGADLSVQPGLADVIGAVVVGQDSGGCNALAVRKYDLAGQFQWSRLYAAEGSCGGVPIASAVVVQESGDAIVGGTATVATDLGQGTYTPAGASDGFLLQLAP